MGINPELQSVYKDNMDANQIDGVSDGVSPEVAAEIGYHTPEQLAKLPDLPEVVPVLSAQTAESEAIRRGRELAKKFHQNPDDFGAAWPTARINRAARIKGSVSAAREVRRQLDANAGKHRPNSAEGATHKYIEDRKRILGGS